MQSSSHVLPEASHSNGKRYTSLFYGQSMRYSTLFVAAVCIAKSSQRRIAPERSRTFPSLPVNSLVKILPGTGELALYFVSFRNIVCYSRRVARDAFFSGQRSEGREDYSSI